jgi:hypothetical protein
VIVEKRHAKRIIAGYKTMILYGGKSYAGVIENLSENGVYVISEPMETAIDFNAGESIDLKVETPTGEHLDLKCKIKWSSKIMPHNVRSRLGLEIIYPPWNKCDHFL